MSRLRAACLLFAGVLALSGCATQQVREQAAADPLQARALDAGRAAIGTWELEGRVALSNGRQGGGSGRIEWQQKQDRYTISLAAPITRQSWRLQGDREGARLEGIQGGPREGDDVEALLLSATQWRIPVRAMTDWARGVVADRSRYGDAVVAHGSDHLPSRIEQAGWRIDYRDWHPASGQQPALPRRIEARQGEASVRLVVDRWQVEPAVATPHEIDADFPEARLQRTLEALDVDNPAADVARQVATGDLRPIAVCGFACLTPGLEAERAGAGRDARILDGTGDVIHGDAHLQLKHRVEAYARAYNRALSAWLAANPQAKPGAQVP